jgi:hypothetical protein
MTFAPLLVVGLVILMTIALVRRRTGRRRGRRRGGSIGPGAAGAIYDLLNEDKRKAVEIIVEQKAEATDPETADDVVKPPRGGR